MRDLLLVFQNTVGGLSIGSIYAMVALGYSLIYRSMGLVNFAHGSIFMIGTYLGVIFYMGMVGGLHVPFVIAFFIGIILTGILGMILERLLRPLAKLDLIYMLVGTIGIGIILDNLAVIIWGAEGFPVPTPIGSTPITVGGVIILPYMLVILLAAAVIVIVMQLFYKRTWVGKAIRASAQDREIASAMGINVNIMNAIAFGAGSALAAAAGILAAPILFVNPALSASVGLKGFAAAILGGFGNLPGAVIGGLLFGVLETTASGFISSAYQGAITFIILALVLAVKPSGILGDGTIEKV